MLTFSFLTPGHCDTSTITCNSKNCVNLSSVIDVKFQTQCQAGKMRAKSHRHTLGKKNDFCNSVPLLMPSCLDKRKPIQREPGWYMWTDGWTDRHDDGKKHLSWLWHVYKFTSLELLKLIPPYIAVSSLLNFCIFPASLWDYLTKNLFHECEIRDSYSSADEFYLLVCDTSINWYQKFCVTLYSLFKENHKH
jgi:hypothetical protein